jgi:chromosome segregation ATPase
VFCSVKCQREEWPTHRPLCSGYTSASIGAALQDTQQQQQHIEGDTTETKLIRAKSTLANTEAKLRDLNKELEALDDAERAKTNAETLDQNAKSEAEAAQQRLAAARTAFARAQSNLAAAEAAVAKANAAATNLPLFVEQQRAQFAADRTKLRDSIRATNERVLATKNRVAKLEKALKEEPDGRASMKKPRKPAAVPSSSAPSSSSSSTVLLPPPPLPRTNNVPTAEDEAAMTLMGDHEELERKRRMAEMYARLSEASSSNHAFGDIQPADNDELSRY